MSTPSPQDPALPAPPPAMLAQTWALCLSMTLLGAQVWGLSVLARHMRESLHHGDPLAASIAQVQGPYFLAGTVLLFLLQLALRFLPGMTRPIRRSMAPLLVLFLLTEAVWLSWALLDFGHHPVIAAGGGLAALLGFVAPIASGTLLRRLLRQAGEVPLARRAILLLLVLCAATWLWSQAFWLSVSIEA